MGAKSLLINLMAYATKQISRNGKRKWEKEIVNFSLEIYSNATWEVGEQGSFLDFNIKVYIHYSTAQTGLVHSKLKIERWHQAKK